MRSLSFSTTTGSSTAENIATTEKLVVSHSATDSILFTTSGAAITSAAGATIGDATSAGILVDETTGKPVFTTGEQINGKTTAAYTTGPDFSDTRGMTPTSGISTTRPRTTRLSTESIVTSQGVYETTVGYTTVNEVSTDPTLIIDDKSTDNIGVIVAESTESNIIATAKVPDEASTTIGETTTVAGKTIREQTTKIFDITEASETITVGDTATSSSGPLLSKSYRG